MTFVCANNSNHERERYSYLSSFHHHRARLSTSIQLIMSVVSPRWDLRSPIEVFSPIAQQESETIHSLNVSTPPESLKGWQQNDSFLCSIPLTPLGAVLAFYINMPWSYSLEAWKTCFPAKNLWLTAYTSRTNQPLAVLIKRWISIYAVRVPLLQNTRILSILIPDLS